MQHVDPGSKLIYSGKPGKVKVLEIGHRVVRELMKIVQNAGSWISWPSRLGPSHCFSNCFRDLIKFDLSDKMLAWLSVCSRV